MAPPTSLSSGSTCVHSDEFVLPLELAECVIACARAEGASVRAVLLAAFEVLLGRYTGGTEVVVAHLPAPAGHAVSVRADLSGGMGFRGLLRQVQAGLKDGRTESAEAAVPRAVFQFRDEGEGTSADMVSLRAEVALDIEFREGRCYGKFFRQGGVACRIATHYVELLANALRSPETDVERLEMLTASERNEVVAKWNDTARSYPQVPVHELIENQAAATPEATAVVLGEEALSYRELNERANRLAHYLTGLGVGPEGVVALFLQRSFEVQVAILATLKTGAAYVPVDTDQPWERASGVLRDAQPAVVLTIAELRPLLRDGTFRTVLLDADWPSIAQQSAENPPATAQLDSPIYVMYTSGSTGAPKGAVVLHRGTANLNAWASSRLGFGPSDIVLHQSRYTFDISIVELMCAPACGAKVVLVPPGGQWDAAQLVSLMQAERVTYFQSVPSLLEMLLDNGLSKCSSLRHVVSGGEPMTANLLSRLAGSLPQAEVWNMYGPTETSVVACCWSGKEAVPGGTVPIGRPLPNVRIYILDRHLQPVPVGVPGELCIAGDGVGRGYLNREELTAERFVACPLGEERLYRTGDRARFLPDGNIEFLGRFDDQVKLRGYRIEVGEIEAALRQHPGIESAAVMVREVAGDKRLVAYTVPKEAPMAVQELREFVRGKVPEHMVPAHFVELRALPLNPNGKVDRKALPEPQAAGEAQQGGSVAAPGSEPPALNGLENQIARIWAEVLRVERVGPGDRFFEMGGHSLSAMQAVSRVNRRLGIDIPAQQLFKTPDLAGFAAAVESARSAKARPAIARRDGSSLAPLSAAQHSMWFCDLLSPGNPAFHLPWAVRLRGELNAGALERSLTALVERHEILRTRYRQVSGEPRQEVLPAPRVAVRVVPATAGQLDGMLRDEARRPFRLSRDLMLRACLFRLGPREHVLLVTFHHIAFDAWSLRIFKQELSELYEAFAAGRAAELPELRLRYTDYCHWERERWGDEEMESRLRHWRRVLSEAPPFLELPSDRARGETPAHTGQRERITFSSGLLERLQTVCRRENCTPFMVLLAGFQMLLHRWSRQDDICIGVPMAERSFPELEPVAGYFVNSVVFRSRLGGAEGFRDLLLRTREATIEAHADRNVPFSKLVDALKPPRQPNRNPIFQVLFTLDTKSGFQMAGLTATEVDVELGAAEFDLSLYLAQRPGGLDGWLLYDAGMFKPRTAKRLMAEYLSLIEDAANGPAAASSTTREEQEVGAGFPRGLRRWLGRWLPVT